MKKQGMSTKQARRIRRKMSIDELYSYIESYNNEVKEIYKFLKDSSKSKRKRTEKLLKLCVFSLSRDKIRETVFRYKQVSKKVRKSVLDVLIKDGVVLLIHSRKGETFIKFTHMDV